MLAPFLPEIELSEKQKIELFQGQALAEKTDRAIKLFRMYAPMADSVSSFGYYLANSGGKDSVTIRRLAEMAGVKFQNFYNQTTIDPPELVRFIQSSREIIWNRPEKNLIMRMEDECQGPPTRLARWCCEIYKEQGGKGLFKVIGVRAAESPRRAKQWRETIANRGGGNILCPILYWTDADVWNFIRQENIKYCSLYDEGLKRLGCVGCPMGGNAGRKRDFERWPRFENLWKIGFQRFWKRWKGVSRLDGKPRWFEKFRSWEELWNWWVEEPEPEQIEPDCQMKLLNI